MCRPLAALREAGYGGSRSPFLLAAGQVPVAIAIATTMRVAVWMAARAADRRANRVSSGVRAASLSPARPIWNMVGAASPVVALCSRDGPVPRAHRPLATPGPPIGRGHVAEALDQSFGRDRPSAAIAGSAIPLPPHPCVPLTS